MWVEPDSGVVNWRDGVAGSATTTSLAIFEIIKHINVRARMTQGALSNKGQRGRSGGYKEEGV